MTEDQIKACDDLWREALAAGLVRWMPGMLTRWRWRALVSAGSRCLAASDGEGLCVWRETHDWLVDWTDPATLGCLLAMAREATGDAKLHCYYCGVDLVWRAVWFLTASDCCGAIGGTEPEALLRAILATRGAR